MEKGRKDLKAKNLAIDILKRAKEKKVIKPISQAFKDVPVQKEIHKGKKEYFK